MIELYLIRHGETTYNAEGRVQGQKDTPLTALGVQQAEALANRLAREKLKCVYSSDLIRAARTAEIVAARHNLSVVTTPLLREANLGVVEGLTAGEIQERFPEKTHEWRRNPIISRPPGAESIEEIVHRCRVFLDTLISERADGDNTQMAIVGHIGSLRGLVLAALAFPIDTYHKFCFSNASLSILELADRNRLALLNDTCHLDSLRGPEWDVDSA